MKKEAHGRFLLNQLKKGPSFELNLHSINKQVNIITEEKEK